MACRRVRQSKHGSKESREMFLHYLWIVFGYFGDVIRVRSNEHTRRWIFEDAPYITERWKKAKRMSSCSVGETFIYRLIRARHVALGSCVSQSAQWNGSHGFLMILETSSTAALVAAAVAESSCSTPLSSWLTVPVVAARWLLLLVICQVLRSDSVDESMNLFVLYYSSNRSMIDRVQKKGCLLHGSCSKNRSNRNPADDNDADHLPWLKSIKGHQLTATSIEERKQVWTNEKKRWSKISKYYLVH